MNEVIDSLAKNELTKIVKCNILSVTLLDEFGNVTKTPSKAVKEIIKVQSDVRIKQLTKEYSSAVKTVSSDSIYGISNKLGEHYASWELNTDEDLNKYIMNNLFKVTYLDFVIDDGNNRNIAIYADTIKNIFMNFSCINIDVVKSPCTIKMPSLDVRLESFKMTRVNVELQGDISFTTDSYIQLESCILNSINNDRMFKFNLVSDNNSIYDLVVRNPISINVYSAKSDLDKYPNQNTSINSIKYILDNIDRDNTFTDALLSFRDIYSVKINDVIFEGANNLKCMKVIQCHQLMINNVKRNGFTKKYTIGLSNIFNTYISNLKDINTVDDGDTHSILIAEDGLKFNQSLVVSDFKVVNIGLIDMCLSKADKISISSGVIKCENPIKFNNFNETKKIRISDVKFETNNFDVACCNLYISDSTVKTDNDINLSVTESNKITDSKLYSDNESVIIKLNLDSSNDISSSEIYSRKSFKIYHDAEGEDDLEGTKFVDETNRTSNISDTNILTDESINIVDIYRSSITRCTLKSKEMRFSDIKNFSLTDVSLGLESAFEFITENVSLKNSTVDIRTITDSTKFKFIKTSGNMDVVFKQSSVDHKVTYDFVYEESSMFVNLDSYGAKLLCKLNSNNSLGSVLFGLHDVIDVVPSMQSKDISSFSNISSVSARKSDKINYGNSGEEITLSDILMD